jgi:hypothetical protein
LFDFASYSFCKLSINDDLVFCFGHGQHNLCLHWFDLCYFSWFKGDIDSILTFHFIFTLLFQKIYTSLMLNSFSSFHWCWTFGVKNNMGLVFSSWNLSSLCHVICVVIEDFNMSLELFVVLCIKMISNLLLGYARRLFNRILNWCCKFYHFQKIKMKAFFVWFFCHVFRKQHMIQMKFVNIFLKVERKRRKRWHWKNFFHKVEDPLTSWQVIST